MGDKGDRDRCRARVSEVDVRGDVGASKSDTGSYGTSRELVEERRLESVRVCR